MNGIDETDISLDKVKAALVRDTEANAAFVADTINKQANKVKSIKIFENIQYALLRNEYNLSFNVSDVCEKISRGIDINQYVFECYCRLNIRILNKKGKVIVDGSYPHSILCEVKALTGYVGELSTGKSIQYRGDFSNLISKM